jgi:thiol-disulfide isomerase/thioredoxin
MNRKSNKIIGFTLLIVSISIIGLAMYYRLNGNVQSKNLYNLRLENENGVAFDLKNFKGKKVFINCWQTWCGPCIAELPMIDSTFLKIDQSQWVFVIVSDESWEKINKMRARFAFKMPFYRSKSSFVRNKIDTYPLSIILNEQGEIIYQFEGMLPYHSNHFLDVLRHY